MDRSSYWAWTAFYAIGFLPLALLLGQLPIGFLSIIIAAIFMFGGLGRLAFKRAEVVGLPAEELSVAIAFSGLAVIGAFYIASQWLGAGIVALGENILGLGGFGVTALIVAAVGLWPENKRMAVVAGE